MFLTVRHIWPFSVLSFDILTPFSPWSVSVCISVPLPRKERHNLKRIGSIPAIFLRITQEQSQYQAVEVYMTFRAYTLYQFDIYPIVPYAPAFCIVLVIFNYGM